MRTQSGFTIVELMIVIIVIAILATVTIVGYRASMNQLVADTMKSDLNGTAAALENHKNFNNGYPAVLSDALKVQSEGNTVTYTARPQGYCLEVMSSRVTKQFYKTETDEGEGQCS